MKKYVLVSIFLVLIAFIVSGSTIQVVKEKSNLYENMVNASVKLLGHGSGVFIEDDMILTAAHCLEGVKTITIELNDGTVLKSSDFYIDGEEDIGFVFVDANELCIAEVSLSDVHIGDTVYLVGRPFDDLFRFSLTKGILSHLDRDLPNMGWKDLIQTDAEGGPGSSGGPLYNSDGNLVGMYVGHTDGGGQGISLCENAKSILEAYQRCKDAKNQEGD